MKDKKDPFKTDKPLYDCTTQYDITHLPKSLQDIIAELENFDILEPSGISYGGHGGIERNYNR